MTGVRRLPHVIAGTVLVWFVVTAASGAGFGPGARTAMFATELARRASAPLYDMLAAIALRLPIGEPALRLGVLAALVGTLVVVGAARLARALLPADPLAPVIAAVLLVLAPPLRDAAAFGTPALLAAAGLVWAIGEAVAHAREPSARRVAAAFAWSGVATGAAPWLGIALAVSLALGLRASRLVAPALAILGVAVVIVWWGAVGPLPALAPDLDGFVAASGTGAAAIVVGAGLLGAAFGVATALPHVRWIALATALGVLHAIAVDGDPTPALAMLAVACAIVPGAIARLATKEHRTRVTLLAALPLVGLALVVGPSLAADDPGSAPTELATDITSELPAGPGIVIATRPPIESALYYEAQVAGARPDLDLAPPLLSGGAASALAVRALADGRIVGADVQHLAIASTPALHARPRGRGFELLAAPAPPDRVPPPAPAHYASDAGDDLAITLALERATYEVAAARLAAAAHAAGLEPRFGATGLAVLAKTVPTRERPAFFGLIPALGTPSGPWRYDLFGDDLAWIANLRQRDMDSPLERKLHALWRRLWRNEIRQDDPAFAALGPAAVEATATMLRALGK